VEVMSDSKLEFEPESVSESKWSWRWEVDEVDGAVSEVGEVNPSPPLKLTRGAMDPARLSTALDCTRAQQWRGLLCGTVEPVPGWSTQAERLWEGRRALSPAVWGPHHGECVRWVEGEEVGSLVAAEVVGGVRGG
jgi:hypothetical protein